MCVLCQGSDKAYLTNVHTEFESHPDFVKGEDRLSKSLGSVTTPAPSSTTSRFRRQQNKDVQLEEEWRLREEEQSKERHNSFASLADMSSM